MPTGIIYSTTPHSPLRPVRRSVMRLVRPAARLGAPSLTRSAVAIHAAVVTLVYPTVQNVLDVLNYQVNGHCRKHGGGSIWLPRRSYLMADKHKCNPYVVCDRCTYRDYLLHVELSHLHISLSVRKIRIRLMPKIRLVWSSNVHL